MKNMKINLDKFGVPLAMVIGGIFGDIFSYGNLWINHENLDTLHIGILIAGLVIAFIGFVWASINFVFNKDN